MSLQEYSLIEQTVSKIKDSFSTVLVMVIGNKGSGKNTLLAFIAWAEEQAKSPTVSISNTKITGAIYVPDIVKWLAIKILENESSVVNFLIDEAAIAGFEARGSYKEARALDSYALTLSRKPNANVFLATQLMSMIEKRGQWIGDFYIYCEAFYEEGSKMPLYFNYTVYDNDLEYLNEFQISGKFAREVLYPRYITEEIPFAERLKRDFSQYYSITREDRMRFYKTMAIEHELEEEPDDNLIAFRDSKALTVGATVFKGGQKLKIVDRTFDIEGRDWSFRARPID
jgi:hypothetical protein